MDTLVDRMNPVRPMPDPKAPKAWMLEHLSMAQVRALQNEICSDLNVLLQEFDTLEGIGDVYRSRCFFEGSLDGNKDSGLLGSHFQVNCSIRSGSVIRIAVPRMAHGR